MDATRKPRISGLLALAAICGLSLGLTYCTAPKRPTASISVVNPPFQKVDVPDQALAFVAEEGAEIRMPNGTRISIPPGAIVDGTGKPVTGKVDLQYREFHNATHILASGITMAYTENGANEVLQTAGMMEINAKVKGEEVFIAPGKEIDVQLASFAPEGDFNLYYLDEKKGWKQIGKPEPAANEEKMEALDNLPQLPPQPIEPRVATDKDFVFDFVPNYKDFPELKTWKGLKWAYAGTDPACDPEKNEKAFNKVWTDFILKPIDAEKQTYQLTPKSRKDSFITVVTPVLDGKNLNKEKEKFEASMAKYEAARTERIETEKSVMNQADMVYSFAVNRFGTYNCDLIYRQGNEVAVAGMVEFDDSDQQIVSLFHVTGDNRAVITYTPETMSGFRFSPNADNKLVAVLKGNKVAAFSQAEFRKLNIERLREDGKYTFRMKVNEDAISNMEDLDAFMRSY